MGEAHAMVKQLHAIVSRMSGSNGGDSTRRIALARGSSPGRRQKRLLLWYTLPLRPVTLSAGC